MDLLTEKRRKCWWKKKRKYLLPFSLFSRKRKEEKTALFNGVHHYFFKNISPIFSKGRKRWRDEFSLSSNLFTSEWRRWDKREKSRREETEKEMMTIITWIRWISFSQSSHFLPSFFPSIFSIIKHPPFQSYMNYIFSLFLCNLPTQFPSWHPNSRKRRKRVKSERRNGRSVRWYWLQDNFYKITFPFQQ